MPTDDRPSRQSAAAEAPLDRLRRAGWTVAEYTIWYVRPPVLVWLVAGEAGAARLLASGLTRDMAAARATEQAEALGEMPPGDAA